jgi:membrane-associated HD superfamily phosphohydrolase
MSGWDRMSRPILAMVVVMLVAAVVVFTVAVVRLENYRYANFLGACTQFDITSPLSVNDALRPRKRERIGFGMFFMALACCERVKD